MELYPHQEKMLEKLTEEESFGIFWKPRVMKTLPVALHMTNLIMSGKAKNAIVIAPKSALGAWKRDFCTFKGKRFEATKKIKLVNYEKVWRRKEYESGADIIILDESHKIANRRSKQSKFIKKIGLKAKYRYILTGTPMGQGRLQDLWNQMDFIKPNLLNTYREFESRYCITRQLPNTYVKIIVGYRNKDELLDIIAPYVSFLTLDDVSDMPEEMADNIVVCPQPNKFIQSGVKNDYVKEYDMIIPNPAVKLAKLRQVASGFIKDDDGVTHDISDTKRFAFGELLDEIGEDEKIVIFCDFRHSIDNAVTEIRKRGISYIVLDGRQQDKEIWRLFQDEDHIKCIVCQYQTANAGIDLWKADNMIFYEPSLSTQMIEQSRERIKRAKLPKPKYYHWLIAKNTVELKIYKQLKKHQDFTLDCMEEWSWAKEDRDEDFVVEV